MRATLACSLGFVLLGMVACGDSALFGDSGQSGTAGQGADATTSNGGSSDGGASTTGGNQGAGAGAGASSVGGGSAAGGSLGGSSAVGGSGQGGDEPWEQPACSPECEQFSGTPICCDKGDGSAPVCVANATGCKCSIAELDESCGGFIPSTTCCADPGSVVGTCKTGSTLGCSCEGEQDVCGFLDECCDKGQGDVCYEDESGCQ